MLEPLRPIPVQFWVGFKVHGTVNKLEYLKFHINTTQVHTNAYNNSVKLLNKPLAGSATNEEGITEAPAATVIPSSLQSPFYSNRICFLNTHV